MKYSYEFAAVKFPILISCYGNLASYHLILPLTVLYPWKDGQRECGVLCLR